MIADEIMTTDVSTVSESVSIGEALAVLSDLEIRHLPVVRDHEVVGILSDRDFRDLGLTTANDMETYERLQARVAPPVSTLMSGDVVTVDRATDVREIIDLMLEEKIGAVPVIDQDTRDLVGMVSYVDVLRATREALG